MFLGQEREAWRPLVATTVNLSDINRFTSETTLRRRLSALESDPCFLQHQVVLSATNL